MSSFIASKAKVVYVGLVEGRPPTPCLPGRDRANLVQPNLLTTKKLRFGCAAKVRTPARTFIMPMISKDKTLNQAGVFATYYGVYGGGSLGVPTPVSGNAEVAVTWYDLVDGSRMKYAASTWDKKNIGVRVGAAIQMAAEMQLLAKINPVGKVMLPLALIELASFVNDP